ncbi:MAG: tetratricopeptide repeat protein [Desulfocurvibacter africanus]
MCACVCLTKLNKDGMEALNRGDYLTATELLIQAAHKAEALGSDVLQAKIRNNMGLLMQAQGLHDQAVMNFRLAQRHTAKRLGTDNSLYARITTNLTKIEGHENVF